MLGAAALALVALLAACGGNGAAEGAARVVLNEWSVAPNVASVTAGQGTFEAANQGVQPHELVVIKTDLAPDKLVMRADEPKVNEEASGQLVGEIEELQPGKTEKGTMTLPAGRYVLICNISGHYQLGMRVAFEAK